MAAKGQSTIRKRKVLLFAVLVAIYAAVCFVRFGATPAACVGVAFAFILLAISFQDIATLTIPNRMVAAVGAVAVAGALAGAPLEAVTVPSRIAGAFAASMPMLLLAWAIHGLGGGDVKLMLGVGFLLGAQLVLAALCVSAVLACAYALALVALRKASAKTVFPFGPFLAAGAMTAYLFAPQMAALFPSLCP